MTLLYVLTDNTDAVGIVHSLIEEVAVELNDVLVVLGLKQLHCFFLHTETRFKLEAVANHH